MKFSVQIPLGGSGLDIDLEEGCYFMAAAGPLDEWLEPKQHIQSNTAVKKVSMGGMRSGGRGEASLFQPSFFFVFSCITLFI